MRAVCQVLCRAHVLQPLRTLLSPCLHSMADAAFAAGLASLGTFPDRAKIEGLAMVAEDALGDAGAVAAVAAALLGGLSSAEPVRKLPILYTLDYIVKHQGAEFVAALAPSIVDAVTAAFSALGRAERDKVRGMLSTWAGQGLFVAELPTLMPQIEAIAARFGPAPAGGVAVPPPAKRPRLEEGGGYGGYGAPPPHHHAPHYPHPAAHPYGGYPGAYPGAPPPPPPYGAYGAPPPPGHPGFYPPPPVHSGAAYPGAPGYPGAAYPGGGYPPGAAYPGGYPGGPPPPPYHEAYPAEAPPAELPAAPAAPAAAAAPLAASGSLSRLLSALRPAAPSAPRPGGDPRSHPGASAPAATTYDARLLEINSAVLAAPDPAAPAALYARLPAKCPHCGTRFGTPSALARHVAGAHGEGGDRAAAPGAGAGGGSKSGGRVLCRAWYGNEEEWPTRTLGDDVIAAAGAAASTAAGARTALATVLRGFVVVREADLFGGGEEEESGLPGAGGNGGAGSGASGNLAGRKRPRDSTDGSGGGDAASVGSDLSEADHFVPVADVAAPNPTCPLCGESFRRRFDEELEAWVYTGAVYSSSGLAHAACLTGAASPAGAKGGAGGRTGAAAGAIPGLSLATQ